MKTIAEDLVSIITIVFNGVQEIEQTILSVLNQKNVKIEYIVIDGGSTDGTLDIIKKFKDKIDIVISEHDYGIYDAINKGINLATGALIGLIHCGDYYTTDAISTVYENFLETKASIIYGDIIIIDEVDKQIIKKTKKSNHRLLKKKMSIYHQSTFISHECYLRNGLYITNFKISADYDLLLNNFLNNQKFSYIPIPLAYFRYGGISGKDIKTLLFENTQIREKYFGRISAKKYLISKKVLFSYYKTRKILFTSLIGTKYYNKIKLLITKLK